MLLRLHRGRTLPHKADLQGLFQIGKVLCRISICLVMEPLKAYYAVDTPPVGFHIFLSDMGSLCPIVGNKTVFTLNPYLG